MDIRSDALVARDRLLAELIDTDDVETGQALWRAAARYNLRDKMERASRLESPARPPLAFNAGEETAVRDLMW